jgi:hypothetical protein
LKFHEKFHNKVFEILLFSNLNLNSIKIFLFLIFQLKNGGISIETMWDVKNGSSRLTFASLKIDDSGYYSCKSNGFESERVHLRVVEDLKRKFFIFSNLQFFLILNLVLSKSIIREKREM